jgi:hypothetical protein
LSVGSGQFPEAQPKKKGPPIGGGPAAQLRDANGYIKRASPMHQLEQNNDGDWNPKEPNQNIAAQLHEKPPLLTIYPLWG